MKGVCTLSGTLLIDLSKAFNCMLHELLIVKLAAYDLYYNSLQKLQSYLSNRKQRTKIYDVYSKIMKRFSEFHKALYQGRCYLISIYVTCFTTLTIAILQVMLIIILLTQVATS